MRVYDWVAMKERDEENALRKARDTALAKGMEERIEKGIKKGMEAKAIEIAQKSISQNLDNKTISLITGLTEECIESLR